MHVVTTWGAAAPFLIVPLQASFGWRASFSVLAVMGVLWAAAWYAWYRDTPAEQPNITAAEVNDIGTGSSGSSHNLPWALALRSANIWAILVVAFCYVFGLYFFISWLHTFLVKGRGFSEAQLLLSTLPFVLGAFGNVCGGFASDALVKRLGLKSGRRAVGLLGLGTAALFTVATILTTNKTATLFFLGLVLAGITAQQSVIVTVVVDIAEKYVGGILGLTNTIANIGGFLFSVSFGYFVTLFASYDLALLPMAILLAIGALSWLRIDATQQLIPAEQAATAPQVGAFALS